MADDYPQVALFGTISGEWREQDIIPVLDELGVTYFNPVVEEWTPDLAEREADVMAHAETIVMVFNNMSPSFTGLAETGWAALGAIQRKQTFILYVDQNYDFDFVETGEGTPDCQQIERYLRHWATSIRKLVIKHAAEFDNDNIQIADDMQGVIALLRKRYPRITA